MTSDTTSPLPARRVTVHQFSIVPIGAPVTRQATRDEVVEREAVWWSGLDPSALNLFGISARLGDPETIAPAKITSRRWRAGSRESFSRPPNDLGAGTGGAGTRLIDIDILSQLDIEHDDSVVTSTLPRPAVQDQAGYYYYFFSFSPGSMSDELYLHELSIYDFPCALLHFVRDYKVDAPSDSGHNPPLRSWIRDGLVLANSSRQIAASVISPRGASDAPSNLADGGLPFSFSVLQLPADVFDSQVDTDLEGFEQVKIQIDDRHISWLLISDDTHVLITLHPDELDRVDGEVLDDATDAPSGQRIARIEADTGPTEWLITLEVALQSLWNKSLALQYLIPLAGGASRGS